MAANPRSPRWRKFQSCFLCSGLSTGDCWLIPGDHHDQDKFRRITALVGPEAVVENWPPRSRDDQNTLACGFLFSCARRDGGRQGCQSTAGSDNRQNGCGRRHSWRRPGQEPLGKADRLQITLVRQEAPSQPTETPADPTAPDVRKVISRAEPKIVSRHWHEPDATNFGVAKSKQAARKGGAARDPRDSQAADRSRPSEPTKRCDHTAVFGGLLRTLNLAPACDS